MGERVRYETVIQNAASPVYINERFESGRNCRGEVALLMDFRMKSGQEAIDMEQMKKLLKLTNNYEVGQKERLDSKETKITERSPEGDELKEKDILIWKTDPAEKRTLQMERSVVENTTATGGMPSQATKEKHF